MNKGLQTHRIQNTVFTLTIKSEPFCFWDRIPQSDPVRPVRPDDMCILYLPHHLRPPTVHRIHLAFPRKIGFIREFFGVLSTRTEQVSPLYYFLIPGLANLSLPDSHCQMMPQHLVCVLFVPATTYTIIVYYSSMCVYPVGVVVLASVCTTLVYC